MAMIDFSAVADIAWQVYRLAPSVPDRLTDPRLIFLRDFPSGSCDSMAYATAAMLLQHGLGDWWIVTQGDGTSCHVWLEWRDDDGSTLYAIDATAHQFPENTEPFIGHGPTPTAERFNEPVEATRFSELPHHWPRDAELALLDHVRTEMA
ncbi:hypothetical protein [Microbacterium imperiale]|uniref:hypothetical protein n=1 Tax=Microbacterium imperiale TaxID=33884 RepID=UPI001AE892A5|nr:hypothetical protein [Microbacterium imperiale]MBP2422200.1 hypothetical protein [Microbacterium imperiale]MDS0200703.1 hypothetical protein [Microbacterium imperiale]